MKITSAAPIPAKGPFRVTSVRRGFVGGGFDGGPSLPKRMAAAAGVPGAALIPETAELFLGFTSTQTQMPGRERIANLETLGFADLGDGYFTHGTHMHLSHLYEDLEAWYLTFSEEQRVDATFHPGLRVAAGTLTVAQGPDDVENEAAVVRDYRQHGQIGHSGSIQPASRLDRDVLGPNGVVYEKGTPIPRRADFNTLDNPFAWSADPTGDKLSTHPAAGLHFVVFNPTSDDFHRGCHLERTDRFHSPSSVEVRPRPRCHFSWRFYAGAGHRSIGQLHRQGKPAMPWSRSTSSRNPSRQ